MRNESDCLLERYRGMDTEDLVELSAKGELTAVATEMLGKVLQEREVSDQKRQAITSVNATNTSNRTNSWDWVWPSILAVIIVRVFGVAGGLVAFGAYYWLKPKIGTSGAVLLAGVLGVGSALGLALMMRA